MEIHTNPAPISPSKFDINKYKFYHLNYSVKYRVTMFALQKLKKKYAKVSATNTVYSIDTHAPPTPLLFLFAKKRYTTVAVSHKKGNS